MNLCVRYRIDEEKTWNLLCTSLPLWVRPREQMETVEEEGEEERDGTREKTEETKEGEKEVSKRRNAIVMAQVLTFDDNKGVSKAKEMLIVS